MIDNAPAIVRELKALIARRTHTKESGKDEHLFRFLQEKILLFLQHIF